MIKKAILSDKFLYLCIFFSLFLIFLCFIFFNRFLNKKEIKHSTQLSNNKQTTELSNRQKARQSSTRQEQSITNLLLTPTIVTKNIISYMYFSYEVETINEEKKLLTIYLKGSEDSLSDAVDLKLNFDNNISIEKIIEGDSFSYYPRKAIMDNYLIITGASLDRKNNFKLALPNTVFVKFLVKIKNNKIKASLRLEERGTEIFYEGKNITNFNNSFKEISLN